MKLSELNERHLFALEMAHVASEQQAMELRGDLRVLVWQVIEALKEDLAARATSS